MEDYKRGYRHLFIHSIGTKYPLYARYTVTGLGYVGERDAGSQPKKAML